MRYERTEYVGDYSITHDYEGTPEEIAKLISLTNDGVKGQEDEIKIERPEGFDPADPKAYFSGPSGKGNEG